MTHTKNITMNGDFFKKFVDVVADSSDCHSDILNVEETVFSDLNLRNTVLYMAENHSESYEGRWKLAHCTKSDLCFYYLESDKPVQATNIKLSTDAEGTDHTCQLDGKVFGLIMSLYAYIFLYYAHIQRNKKSRANSHRSDGHSIRRRFGRLAKDFIEEPSLHNITGNDAEQIKAMWVFIEKYTKEDYEA